MKVKKLVKTRQDTEEVVGVTDKIMEISGVTDQGEKVAEDVKPDRDMVEHKVIGEVIACSKPSFPVTFWRPWEESVREWRSEATTLLGDEPVTPPLLVTTSRRSQRAQAKNTDRLLRFHQKC